MNEPYDGPVADFAIVGLGPRGLMILERIIAFARRHAETRVRVVVVEPGELGVGSHRRGQPDYLRLNTVACQLSMFPGRIDGAVEGHYGPSLFEWCLAREILVEDQHDRQGGKMRSVQATDFLPRRLLGDYLAWYAGYLLVLAPPSMTVAVKQKSAIDVLRAKSRHAFDVLLEDGECIPADNVFLTIGHPRAPSDRPRRAERGEARHVYPLPESLDRLQPGARIGILGLGLSAMDAMVAAIDGWGGGFARDPEGRLRYRRSGREGRITFMTRTGLPYLGRPDMDPERAPHQPIFLTPPAIEEIVERAGPDGFDFEEAILPLMRLEMIAAYHMCNLADHSKPGVIAALKARRTDDPLADVLSGLDRTGWHFDPDRYLVPSAPDAASGEDYDSWLLREIGADLAECRRGLRGSPVKAALEVWRDMRDCLRAVIDSPGLSRRSRYAFFQTYAPMINRLVAGPEWKRIAELRCLLREGIAEVVRTGGCPGTAAPAYAGKPDFDLLLQGRVEPAGISRSDSPLLGHLHRRGLVASNDAATGVDGVLVDRMGNAIGRDGRTEDRLWVFGPPAEGASYYNHYVPSPGRPSRSHVDAHRAVKRCFDAIRVVGVQAGEDCGGRRSEAVF